MYWNPVSVQYSLISVYIYVLVNFSISLFCTCVNNVDDDQSYLCFISYSTEGAGNRYPTDPAEGAINDERFDDFPSFARSFDDVRRQMEDSFDEMFRMFGTDSMPMFDPYIPPPQGLLSFLVAYNI